jgi:hypothetical protein
MEAGARILTESDLRDVTTTKMTQYGAVGQTEDGRRFRYVGTGATGLTAGLLGVSAPKVANHENISLTAGSNVAVGSRLITATLGATAATQDQYAEGFLYVVDGTGKGATYRISGNSAAASAGSVQIYLAEPLFTALSVADTKVTLAASNYAGVTPSTTLAKAAGVASVAIPASNFGWVQTHGVAAPLAQGAVTKGFPFKQSTTVAGAVTVGSAATDQTLGTADEALVDTKYYRATINID